MTDKDLRKCAGVLEAEAQRLRAACKVPEWRCVECKGTDVELALMVHASRCRLIWDAWYGNGHCHSCDAAVKIEEVPNDGEEGQPTVAG